MPTRQTESTLPPSSSKESVNARHLQFHLHEYYYCNARLSQRTDTRTLTPRERMRKWKASAKFAEAPREVWASTGEQACVRRAPLLFLFPCFSQAPQKGTEQRSRADFRSCASLPPLRWMGRGWSPILLAGSRGICIFLGVSTLLSLPFVFDFQLNSCA